MKVKKNNQPIKNKFEAKKNKKKNASAGKKGAIKRIGVKMKSVPAIIEKDMLADSNELTDKADMQTEVIHSTEMDTENKNHSELLESRDNCENTIYVGNVNIDTTTKSLSRVFSQYGKVKSVRLRGAAVPDHKTSKKAAIIKRTFHDKRTSIIAYVTFAEKRMVDQALEANGTELDGKHLHVDRAIAIHSNKHAVFVGNLPFEAEDEGLRSLFAECGDIESVRIVRDKFSGIGKGFGYVNFKHADSIEIALQLDNTKFMKREIRVKRYSKKPKSKKMNGNIPAKSPNFKSQGKGKVMKTRKRDFSGKMKETKLNNKRSRENKPERRLYKDKKMNPGRADFSGKRMLETKTFKKIKKSKQMPSKDQRKKRAVAYILQGSK